MKIRAIRQKVYKCIYITFLLPLLPSYYYYYILYIYIKNIYYNTKNQAVRGN